AWSSGIGLLACPGQAGRPAPLPETHPVRGHLIGYDMPPGTLGPILRHGHTYVLQRASGFVVAGSTSEEVGFDRTIDPGAVTDIRRRAARLLPAIGGREPREAWVGFRPAIRGEMPAIGRVEDSNLWLAYGHYRNGILLAPVTAERIS